MDNYLMYLRKSRADKDFKEEPILDTLKRHKTRLDELCAARDIFVVETLYEVSSADSIAGRPEMMRLLSLVETGDYAGVVCVDMDRLSRGSGADQALVINTFKYSNTKIITPLKDYDFTNESDEQFAELGLFIGRNEYRLIKRRLMQGRIDSAKEGKFVTGNPPYGYETFKLQNQKGYSLKIVPEQAEVIRLIYRLYIDNNLGCKAIAVYLNTHDIQNQRGEFWRDGHIYKILNDPVYIGKIRFRYKAQFNEMRNGQIVKTRHRHTDKMIIADGLHEAIISQEDFDAVKEAKKKRYTPHVRIDKKMQNPLCSLVVCDQCGKKLIYRAAKKGGNATLYCHTPGCITKGAQIKLIEERILEALENWLAGYQIEEFAKSRLPDLETEHKQLSAELAYEKKRLDKIADLLERDIYTPLEYGRRTDICLERIKTLSERLNVLDGEIIETKTYEANVLILSPKIRTVVEQYKTLQDAKQKNLFLKAVIDRIEYHKSTTGKANLDDFTLTIYPKIPKIE